MERPNNSLLAIGCVAVLSAAGIFAFVILGFVAYGLSSGKLASTAALPQNKIPSSQLAEIAKIVSLGPSEQVLFFYSTAVTVAGDGNLFTNERVISYTSDSDSTHVFDATYDEIDDIAFFPSTSWFDDSIITITEQDGTTFELWVSTESGRDQAFYNRLVQEWKRNRDAEDTDSNQNGS